MSATSPVLLCYVLGWSASEVGLNHPANHPALPINEGSGHLIDDGPSILSAARRNTMEAQDRTGPGNEREAKAVWGPRTSVCKLVDRRRAASHGRRLLPTTPPVPSPLFLLCPLLPHVSHQQKRQAPAAADHHHAANPRVYEEGGGGSNAAAGRWCR